jgi:hypothetical protein
LRFGVTKKLWIRACFGVVQQLLLAYGGRNDVHDWFAIVIRRLFVFVALAHSSRKYRWRSLLICEALVGLAQLQIPWLQQKIAAIASGIATRPVPLYFRSFFQTSTSLVDDLTIHEFDIFAGFQVPLKAFPFDLKRKVLMLAPVRDAMPVTPKGGWPKPVIKVMRSDSNIHGDSTVVVVKKKSPKGKKKVVNSALINRRRNPVLLTRRATGPSEQKLPGIGRPGI